MLTLNTDTVLTILTIRIKICIIIILQFQDDIYFWKSYILLMYVQKYKFASTKKKYIHIKKKSFNDK